MWQWVERFELTPPENPEPPTRGDFASHPSAEALNAAAMVTVCEQAPRVSAQQAVMPRPSRPQDPPEDDPPAGNAPKSPAPPPKSPSGGFFLNSLPTNDSAEEAPPPKTMGVTDYTYRWHDPLTGRWPSRDPIGKRGGVNLYGFVGNDGVNCWDLLELEKSGLFETKKAAMHDGVIQDSKKSDEDLKQRKDEHDKLKPEKRIMTDRPMWALEFCGRACRNRDNKYYWTGFSRGSNQKCDPATEATECDNGDEFVGIHHNHPKGSEGIGGLSQEDYDFVRDGRDFPGIPENKKAPKGLDISATYKKTDGSHTTDFSNPNTPDMITPR